MGFRGHTDQVECAAAFPDSQRIASGSRGADLVVTGSCDSTAKSGIYVQKDAPRSEKLSIEEACAVVQKTLDCQEVDN